MLPIRDNIPASTRPVMNILIITVTALVFLAQLSGIVGDRESDRDVLVERFGMVPARVFHPHKRIVVKSQVLEHTIDGAVIRDQTRVIEPTVFPVILTLLTCVFLHGGWLHFLCNMWFLYIFGDNVEDRLGHVGFLFFYLLCGFGASLAQLLIYPSAVIPTIGASGAIAGVMGAYFLLYPHARVLTFVPIFILFYLFPVPAPVFIGLWFVIQFFQGTLSIGSLAEGGVAWWAHIGGFVVGYLAVLLLRRTGWLRPPIGSVVPMTRRRGVYQRGG